MMWMVWTALLLLSNALHGCTPPPAPIVSGGTTVVTMAGKKFTLEVAGDDAVRMKGLGGRTSIAEDGGMIFTFTRSQRGSVMTFVMRDCPIDIDILYLDGAGRVLTTYTMKAEPPRAEDEGVAGDSDLNTVTDTKRREGDVKYESRLKKIYTSRFPCTFVIEVKPGTIAKLGVKEGDKVELDADGLKQVAK